PNRVVTTAPRHDNLMPANRLNPTLVHTTTRNLIQGNYIGTNDSGTPGLGNAEDGIWLDKASNTTIGGTVPGARNIISANGWNGVEVTGTTGSGNLIQGNYIGTDPTGAAPLGNFARGVLIAGSTGTTVGGTTGSVGNRIAY